MVWDTEVNRHCESGFIDNEELVARIGDPRGQWIMMRMAIEMMEGYGMRVGKEVFRTCIWTGRFIQAALGEYIAMTVSEVLRSDIKIHLCGTKRADDSAVRQALIDKYGPKGTKEAPGPLHGITGHCWSALAVADYATTKL